MAEKTPKNEEAEAAWKDKLSAEEYRICRQCGTEPAFSGKYWDTKTDGIYHCKCCNEPLFDSQTKYDSGSGWPSFYAPISKDVIVEEFDTSFGMRRVEILCGKCQSHLGHVFPDGPEPTGLRYCVNSASLELVEGREE
ncbi:peptide-methionine (R)-S-oxide reductase MsrB [Sessilibacter sp. MAH4]